MPIPNLLESKYGVKAEPSATKKGIPDLIGTKYQNFQEAPAPAPTPKPSLLKRATSAVTKFLAGATEAPTYTGAKGEVARNLPGEIVRTILPGAAAASDLGQAAEAGDQESIDTLTNLQNKDIVKAVPKAGFEAFVAPVASYPLTFYGAGSQLAEKAGLGKAPGVGEDGRVSIKTPLGDITNVQERVSKEAEVRGIPTTKLGETATVAKHTAFELLNGLFTASMVGKAVNPRVAPITGKGRVGTREVFPAEQGPRSGQLYEPQVYNQRLTPEFVAKVTDEYNIPVSRSYDPKNPVFFQVSEVKPGGESVGQFFQIKPSYMKVFQQLFKGDPTNVPKNQLVVIAQTNKPTGQLIPPAPRVAVQEPPTATIPPKPVDIPSKPSTLTVKPEVTTKEVVPPGKVPTPVVKIGEQVVVRPEQLISKSQAKDILSGIGKESVTFNVEDVNGKKYMVYVDDRHNIKIRPSAFGLVETNIVPGQQININAQDLKATGRGFKAVDEAGDIQASLKDDLAASESNPAKTPDELAKRIEQLNKFGQSQGILRKTGGVDKRAAGHFASGPKATKTFKRGKVELRHETVQSPQQYMSTLAHELGHAMEFSLTGTTNSRTYEVFGKNLTKEQLAKLKAELKEVTNNLVGKELAESNPSYYYKSTEMLARFLESMFVKPGSINDLAPTAMEFLEKAAVENPIIAEYLEAVAGNIDKGELKHIFWRDMRQSFTKTLGTRNGNQAWNHVVRYRAMKERAKFQIEQLIKDKFKDVDDDPALLFQAVESIKVTKEGQPEFGTRDFLNAKNPEEVAKLEETGYRKVLNEEGKQVYDLVDGESLARYARVRYTPAQGKAIFESLSPAGKKLVKDFTAQYDEAQDYFNREVIKQVHKINSNIEGWVHHYWEDVPFDRGGPKLGGKLKLKTASSRRQRLGAEGYVEDLKKAMLKSLTELETEKAYNAFMKEFFPRVTRPIAKGEKPDEGWVEVFGDIAKGGVGRAQEVRTVVINKGKTFVPEKPRYQMPKEVYARFEMLRGLSDEATKSMRILNSIMRYWRVNILFHMGSNATNFISGGIQYSAKLLTDFYSEVLTGNISLPQTRSNIYAMLNTITPRGWQNAPDWVYGGDQTNQYGQLLEDRAPGIKVLEESIDAYADKALKLYGTIERYWKKVIANAEGVSNLKNLNTITKEGLRLPTKEEEEMIDYINREVDLYALDYDNVSVFLQQYKRGFLGQAIKPFAIYPYKITKTYTDMVQAAFDGTRPWNERMASIMAFGTLVGVSAYIIDRNRKNQTTPAAGEETPGAVSPAGKVFLGTDEEGKEKFTRISKYPFVNLSEAGLQASEGNLEDAWRVIRDMIGSVGPGGQVAAAVLGYKLDYQQYMTPDVIAGQALSAFVPGSRILNDIASYKDPYLRKQETFLQGFTSFYPTSDPELQEKLRGKIRTIQVPLEGGVKPAGDVMGEGRRRTTTDMYLRNYKQDILMQALLGIYIKRIDPDVAEAFQIREEKNALKKSTDGALNPFYKSN